jgi:hypothetical protein
MQPKGFQKSAWAPGSILGAKTKAFPIPIWIHFGSIFRPKSRQKIDAKTDVEKHENNCKRLPKWNRNRCQNASKINARTGIEKDQGNHQKSCFSEE